MGKSIEGKSTAIIAYLTLVGCLIAITMNMEPKHDFARFHIRQAFGLHLVFHALAYSLSFLNSFSTMVGLYGIFFVIWAYAIYMASQEKKTELPLLGSHFQKWFTFIS